MMKQSYQSLLLHGPKEREIQKKIVKTMSALYAKYLLQVFILCNN